MVRLSLSRRGSTILPIGSSSTTWHARARWDSRLELEVGLDFGFDVLYHVDNLPSYLSIACIIQPLTYLDSTLTEHILAPPSLI